MPKFGRVVGANGVAGIRAEEDTAEEVADRDTTLDCLAKIRHRIELAMKMEIEGKGNGASPSLSLLTYNASRVKRPSIQTSPHFTLHTHRYMAQARKAALAKLNASRAGEKRTKQYGVRTFTVLNSILSANATVPYARKI